MKKYKILIIILFIYIAKSGYAQINSVTFSGLYANTFQKNSTWKIEKADGFGGQLDIKFNLVDNFKINISAGYIHYAIGQDNLALFAQYNWRYWKRYFGDINDPNFKNSTQWVQAILKDSSYSASFNPVQSVETFPVNLTVIYDMPFGENMIFRPAIGGGVIFYQKRLYVEETWKKKFSQLDNYVYSYSFRNMDENVNGVVLNASAGLEVDYKVTDIVKFVGAVNYHYVFPIKGENFDNLPMKDMFLFRLGIALLY